VAIEDPRDGYGYISPPNRDSWPKLKKLKQTSQAQSEKCVW